MIESAVYSATNGDYNAKFVVWQARKGSYAHERRVAIKHAQDLVATAIRYFDQYAVNTCLAVGREYGLVCRCIERRD